jgi:PKD repeat protein
MYFVFTPVKVGSCFDSTALTCAYTQYCGFHSFIGTAGTASEILYAHEPWAYNISGCDTNIAFGTGYPNADAIDPVVSTLSHEASETMTDPNLNAWYDSSGNEDGDKCSYLYGNGGYGSLSGLANNGLGYYNYTFSTDQYLMQLEWDNRLLTCARTNTDVQPTVTISPATATHGVATAFTATVTDPAGLAYVSWSFGDGTATTTTTVNSQSHTYATAGSYTLTTIVTDNHGNTKKSLLSVTVS